MKSCRCTSASQAWASGAGAAAMEELVESTRAHLEGRPFTPKVIPLPYAFNVFSHNTAIDPETAGMLTADRRISAARLKRDLGWAPRYPSWRTALAAGLSWC